MGTNNPQGTVEALIEVAARNLGFIEGPKNNENPYAKVAEHANIQPWCASFVAACSIRAGVKLPNNSAYTPTMANGFKQQGRYHKSNPQRGDIVFFFWPNMGRIAHVGIVESVNADGSIRTIEGNTNGGGSRTGGMVVRLVRKANIDGYGRPEFAPSAPPAPVHAEPLPRSRQVEQKRAAPKPAPAPAKPAAPAKKANPYPQPVLTKARPSLRASSKKTRDEVRYIQWAVGEKTDGLWGSDTSAGVRAFQTASKLVVDGEVGPKTLAALAKVRR